MSQIANRNPQDNRVVRFPGRRAAVIRVIPDGPAWLVLAHEHGWAHGSRESAVADAEWLAANLNLRILEGVA